MFLRKKKNQLIYSDFLSYLNIVWRDFRAKLNRLRDLIHSQELQRRLDQTLGKPGSYLAGLDRAGNMKPMTIGARLYRVEQQVRLCFLLLL